MTDRLERLLNLVIALRETRRPLLAREIHDRVAGYDQDDPAAFRRMFERDKADLRALGVPLETAPLDRLDDRDGYRIDPRRYDLPPVQLAPDELGALAVALQITGQLAASRNVLRRLAVDADAPILADLDPQVPVEVELSAANRDLLLLAQTSRTTVRFTYRSTDGVEAERRVHPHGLVLRTGRWYVVGHDLDREAVRSFRLDRVRGDVALQGGPGAFDPPHRPVSVQDVVPGGRDAHTTAEVAVTAGATLPTGWGSGEGEPLFDGRVRHEVAVGDPGAFVALVLGAAGEIEVIAPAHLRELVAARAAELAGDGP